MNRATCPECGEELAAAMGRVCPGCFLRLGLEEDDLAASPDDGDLVEKIGPYRLVHLLGEGGMGTVWLAEQFEPVRRTVAVKLVKERMASREAMERFEFERRVLEHLEHPGIARLLDAGKSADGRPYFVMERVEGAPLDAFCNEGRLDTRERIGLFVQVCEAVEYAHQRGVIHRDLKPGNVLVSDAHPAPRAKVIDFGIAKRLVDPLFETAMPTLAGRWAGTP